MSTLSYQTIKKLCISHALVVPWTEKQICNGMSYGLSQNGYDVRIKQRIVLYPVTLPNLIHNFLADAFPWLKLEKRPSFCLASTIERFEIPDFIKFEVKDKSSWARLGLAVQNTIGEAGWRGFLTLELTNGGENIIIIEAGSPIAQLIFDYLDEPTEKPYANGKYQDQIDAPVPAIEEKRPVGTCLENEDGSYTEVIV